jgi:hypothetical protein
MEDPMKNTPVIVLSLTLVMVSFGFKNASAWGGDCDHGLMNCLADCTFERWSCLDDCTVDYNQCMDALNYLRVQLEDPTLTPAQREAILDALLYGEADCTDQGLLCDVDCNADKEVCDIECEISCGLPE